MRKRLFILISIVMLLCMAIPAGAIQLGTNFNLDTEVKAARAFDADYSVTNDIENLNITAKEHEWFLSAEIGLKMFNLVRPYVALETVTGIYAKRTYGMEVTYPVLGIADVGVWAAYISQENYGVLKDHYGMAGFVGRF